MFKAIYQTFEDSTDPSRGQGRLAALRQALASRGLDGFVVCRDRTPTRTNMCLSPPSGSPG